MKQRSTSRKITNCDVEEVSGITLCDEDLRDIYITGVVTKETAQNVMAALRHLDETKGNINLFINTEGGGTSPGFAIGDAIKNCKNKVIGHCYGECMSMGVYVLQACDARLSAPNTRFMVHELQLVGNGGQMPLSDLKMVIEEFDIADKKYRDGLLEKSDLTEKEVIALCSKDTYMSAEVAMGYGLLDGIIDTGEIRWPKKAKKGKK